MPARAAPPSAATGSCACSVPEKTRKPRRTGDEADPAGLYVRYRHVGHTRLAERVSQMETNRNDEGGWVSGPPRRYPEVPERSEGLEGRCSAVQLLCCASFEARPTSSGERLRMTRQNKRCPPQHRHSDQGEGLPKFHSVDRPPGRCATRNDGQVCVRLVRNKPTTSVALLTPRAVPQAPPARGRAAR
jgi:hypothetical protein